MKSRTWKRALQLFSLSSFAWLVSAQFAFAQVNTFYEGFILGDASPIDIIIAIINWTLGILALIALVIVLWGGFTWMFSQGEEEKIQKAKGILRNGLIGLAIVLAAWGIATYVINLFLDITGASTSDYAVPTDPYEPSNGSPFYIDHSNPRDAATDVPLCHIVAVTFSYPLNESSISDTSFKVTIPQDAASNADGGRGNNASCTDDVQCLSGACSDSNVCDGDVVPGSFDFSESDYAAVFYPAADYLAGTLYKVELTTDVEGINPETGAVYNLTPGDPKRVFNFTTGTSTDDIPPKVDVTTVTPYPEDGATEMCLNPILQVSFSESLDPASPSDQNFWLYPYTADNAPADTLDINNIRLSSIGGEADDTIVTSPQTQLESFTEYGLNLYSGDPATDTFEGAIYDTCGNPLSGDFDDEMEGSPTDDFVDPNSSAVDSGYSYQWTFTTGDEPYCVPDIETISYDDPLYYSEDLDPTDETGAEDSGKVLLTGSYLYPFYDVDFNNNISAGAGQNCFNTGHTADMSCFVSNDGSSAVTVRTPAGSQTGRLSVENNNGSDYSSQSAMINSPFILNTSPLSGPAGQYITIRGSNFIDYDPEVVGSTPGHVFFDGIEAGIMCADGWNDRSIIVRVPDGFTAGDVPLIQVITTEGRYSNQEGFTITDGQPGPGICELVPSCSDTGFDGVTAVGENFGSNEGRAYLDPAGPTAFLDWPIARDGWNIPYGDSQAIVTDGGLTPFTDRSVYNFTVASAVADTSISNGLDFEITCSEPPRLFQYAQCDLEQDTYYLPNPTGYSDNACVNSVVYFGFTNAMDDTSVEANTAVYRCNNGDAFDESLCELTPISGSYDEDHLNAGYLGGDSAIPLDGRADVDGDGELDTYSAYTFSPLGGFQAGYYYKVVVPSSITNTAGVQLDSDYSWHFRIRNDAANCVADYLALTPAAERVNAYSSFDACLDNFVVGHTATSTGTSYSFRARPATADCLVLNDTGDYTWTITEPSATDILTFGDNRTTGDTLDTDATPTADTTTNGYNTVCLQGEQETNDGLATVTATILDSSDGSDAASAHADVEVDFGYCTQDSDCYTDSCRDTYCDATTSHCAPDVTGFSPDDPTSPDAGPGGCLTLNGCYFGPTQNQDDYCTCTDLSSNETCNIDEGGVACLLSNGISSCTLGEAWCTLPDDATCNTELASANYDLGFFRGCDCTTTEATPRTCRVEDGGTQCEVAGTATCADPLGVSNGTYADGGSGSVNFTTATDVVDATYPSEVICEDIWDNDQAVVKVPEDGSVLGDYALTLTSYYGLGNTYGTAVGESLCTIGADPTACLCQADPNSGHESDLVDLYGENFDLIADGTEKVTFAGPLIRQDAEDGGWVEGVCSDPVYTTATTCAAAGETWVAEATAVNDAVVPAGAVSSEVGVQLESHSGYSNALNFDVSCSSNLDCATGCCSAGQCSNAAVCNACTNDTDCSYNGCNSACVSGTCAPYINDISPDAGAEGQPVTIQGCHFGSYYDSSYTINSQVTFDGIAADMACNPTDSWNNLQIIATAPNDIFSSSDTDSSALVKVQQVYTSASTGSQESQPSNEVTFSQDDSCSAVTLPVLCSASPRYGPLTTDYDIALNGENLQNRNDGYCTCTTDYGDCTIAEGTSTSCTVTQSTDYYVNPDFTSETCADGSAGTMTSNRYAYYDGTVYDTDTGRLGLCIYTDPDHKNPDGSDITCNISVGKSTCTISHPDTCYADGGDDTATHAGCSESLSSFTSLDGSATYFNDVQANINWDAYYSTRYTTDVPTGSSTGDVMAISTTSDGTQCTSNGIEFPVSCSSCGECGSTRTNALNCNLDAADVPYGSCTAETTGFCRAQPNSCCNQTSCIYDGSVADTEDTGTCAAQPLLEFDDADADGLTDDYESGYAGHYNNEHQDTDSDGTIDSDEAGLFNNNNALVTIESVTYPMPNATSVCANAEIRIQFNQPITTSYAFDVNDNDVTADDPTTELDESSPEDLYTDDIAPTDINFTDYIKLRQVVSGRDALTDDATVLSDATLSNDGKTLTLERNSTLSFDGTYEIIIRSGNGLLGAAVEPGKDYQNGIIDAETGVAIGCTTEMSSLGICHTGYLKYTFTVSSEAVYEDSCGPSYVVLDATNQSFIDNSYTFTESGQTEDIAATVYAVGEDGVAGNSDDQPITRIDDGIEPGFWWEYTWDPLYASISDLEHASCPVAGIITDDEAGSCSCPITESCTIAEGDEICTTDDGVQCYTDSPNGVCDDQDSHYIAADDATDAACSCTVTDSCTMLPADSVNPAEASCRTDVNGTEVTCAASSPVSHVCDENDPHWNDGSFTADQSTQTLTADSPDANADNTDTVDVTVTGDGSVEDGWGNDTSDDDNLTDSLLYDFVYCDPDYLVNYDSAVWARVDGGADYNFYWAYCRGTDPQSESFLPEFERVFGRNSFGIATAYGSTQEFIYEVGFKDTRAATNDPTTNNNLIVLRVYPNDFNGSLGSPGDAVNPDLWYLLNTNNADAQTTATTVDGYDAVTVGNTVYIAASNLNNFSSKIAPYVFVVAYSADASAETSSVAAALLEGFKFNRNPTLSGECALEKHKLIADTNRVTDLGSLAYLLSSYYYNDSDANGSDDFPALDSGSYISGLTTSVWPSWTDNLGDVLGQALPIDPVNEFNDASAQCPYNPPDLSAGETVGTYYDESGTCWDPVLKDFKGPAGSSVYLYQYEDATDFALYSNLEYDGTGSWINGDYDPCADNEYSDSGCKTFDYKVDNSVTTDNSTYAELFSE